MTKNRLHILFLCFLLLPALLFAQGVTTSAINGTVLDSKGQALPDRKSVV